MTDTKAIRDRILQLALKGELVEQNPQDEPASNLVDELCKSLGYKSFEPDFSVEDIPYDIPSSWAWCRLSDIGTTNIGLTYHPEDVKENGVIVARSSNITNGKMDYSDLVKVSCDIRENQYLYNNDILICARNGSKALVGKCAVYEGDSKKIAFGAFMAVFRTPLFRYVYRYFNTDVFKRNFIRDDSKQINQVTQNILKQSLIPIPPLSEQNRIVEKIDAIFEILDKIDTLQERYASNKEALKSRLIEAAIQGKITEQIPEDGIAEELYQKIIEEKQRLTKEGKIKKSKELAEIAEEEILFDIPNNWKWVRLSDVIDVRDGTHDSPKYHDEGIPLVTSKNISSGKLSFDDVKLISEVDANKINERSYVDDGDILFAMIGSIGNPVIVHKDREFCIKNVALFKNFAPDCISMQYVYWFLMHEQYVLRKNAIGGLQPFVSLKVFRNHLMPLPPFDEQERISKRLYELMNIVSER